VSPVEDGAVHTNVAWRYLARLATLHGAILLFLVGLLIATLGAPLVGVPALFLAVVAWVAAVTSAWIGALRDRAGKKVVGLRSLTADAQDRMGWGEVETAARVVGLRPGLVRRTLMYATVAAVATAVAIVVAAIAAR
jgi:hypothetical protein